MEIEIRGLREVQKTLYSYSQQLGDRVVLGALRQGANLVKKQAQANAPLKTGKLREHIVVLKSRIHRGRLSGDLLGVSLTIRRRRTELFYGRIQEDGWKAGKTHVPGKKFIDRAFIEKRAAAVDLIVRAASSSADLLARKLGL